MANRDQELIEYCVGELRNRHACHTVILYGSHARGDATAASDFDLVGFNAGTEKIRDARIHDGRYLDLVILPPSVWENPDESQLQIRGGKILLESEGRGEAFLKKLHE